MSYLPASFTRCSAMMIDMGLHNLPDPSTALSKLVGWQGRSTLARTDPPAGICMLADVVQAVSMHRSPAFVVPLLFMQDMMETLAGAVKSGVRADQQSSTGSAVSFQLSTQPLTWLPDREGVIDAGNVLPGPAFIKDAVPGHFFW